jgi:hypothetical protein
MHAHKYDATRELNIQTSQTEHTFHRKHFNNYRNNNNKEKNNTPML